MNNKKYYWIIDGNQYEVTKETYQKFKKNYDHAKRMKNYKKNTGIEVLSLDENIFREITSYEMLADSDVNVEDEAVHNLEIEKLKEIIAKLSEKEQSLIEQLYKLEMTEREIALKLGVSQNAVHKRKVKLLTRLKKYLEN